MAVGDVYEVRILWSDAATSKTISSRFRGTQTGAAAPTMDFVGDVVTSWWDGGLSGATDAQKTHHVDDIALQKIQLQRVRPFEALIQEYTDGLPIVGTLAGDEAPPQTSVLASLRTEFAGRRYRGRMYLPPTGEGQLDTQGNLTTANALAVADNLMSMFAVLDDGRVAPVSGALLPVIWSEVANETNAIIRVKVDQRQRTQRRRALRTPAYQSS